MEEYLKKRFEEKLDEGDEVDVKIICDETSQRSDKWKMRIKISHKDIFYEEDLYLRDILTCGRYVEISEIVARFKDHVRNELMRRFYKD